GIATTPRDAFRALPPISTPPISTWPRDSEGGKRTDERRPTGRAAVRESGASPPTCTPARGLRTVLQTGLTTRECPVKMCTNVTMLHVSTGQDVVLWLSPRPRSPLEDRACRPRRSSPWPAPRSSPPCTRHPPQRRTPPLLVTSHRRWRSRNPSSSCGPFPGTSWQGCP